VNTQCVVLTKALEKVHKGDHT